MPAGTTEEPTPPPARFVPPELVDLRTAWRRERALAHRPDARHDGGPGSSCSGRHGWLLDDGYDAVLETTLGPNLGAGAGYYPFAELDAAAASGLLARLPEEYLTTERQNLGPTIGSVLRALVRHPDRLRAGGYVIGPVRCDERITVTTVLVRVEGTLRLPARHSDGCECHDLVAVLMGELGVDDMCAPPDEITPWYGPDPGRPVPDDPTGARWYRLWWD